MFCKDTSVSDLEELDDILTVALYYSESGT